MSWTFMILALILVVFCPRPVLAQSPGNIAGVMTRWQTSTATACKNTFDGYANQSKCPRSLMFSITPDLDGLTLVQWVNTLTSAGVNTGIIYVTPAARLLTTPMVDQATWTAYNQYIYLPQNTLTADQKQVILQVGEAISKDEYTVAQRDDAIVTFLAQLQSAYPGTPPITFILDEHSWFIDALNPTGTPVPLRLVKVFALEESYSDDIAGIVQAAAQQNLGGWLAGVRLSEYAAKDWNLIGPVMIDLVSEINAKTSGWLTTHTFIGAGGGWGQDWKGVNAMQCPATQGWQFASCTGAFPFFQYMAPQVGYFAFGDKFMQFGKAQQYMLNGAPSGLQYTSISAEMTDFCKENTQAYHCDNTTSPSTKDWGAFLEDDVDGLGFADLVTFLSANAQQYPQLANVIFDGDDSDSLATIMTGKSDKAEPALSALFSNAAQGRFMNVETGDETDGLSLGSWTGKIFLDGFDDLTTVPRPKFYGDTGYSMFDTNNNDFTFGTPNVETVPRQKTTAIWSTWP